MHSGYPNGPEERLLHPLSLGLDCGAKGDAGAWAPHRQRVRHRRTTASPRHRPAVARRAAILVVRLGQRLAGDHDSWRLRCVAGKLRGGRSSGADRARALQRLLRHGQHGAGPAGARRSPWAPPRCNADRAHHRPARRHRRPSRRCGQENSAMSMARPRPMAIVPSPTPRISDDTARACRFRA